MERISQFRDEGLMGGKCSFQLLYEPPQLIISGIVLHLSLLSCYIEKMGGGDDINPLHLRLA